MNASIKSLYHSIHFKVIFTDRVLSWSFLTTGLLLLLSGVFVFFTYQNLPPFIPLYNQMPWGQARLGSQPFIFLPLFITLCIFIINALFASVVYIKVPLLARLFAITTLLFSFMAILFIIRTILIIV